MTPPLVTFFWRITSAVYADFDGEDMDVTTAELMREAAGMSIRPAWIKIVGPDELDVYVFEEDEGTANVDLLAAAFGVKSKERPGDPDPDDPGRAVPSSRDWVATVPIPPLVPSAPSNGNGARE